MRKIFAFILLFLSELVAGQHTFVDTSSYLKLSQFKVVNYHSGNGLAQNSVTDLYTQDSGLLLFITELSVQSFDGKTFRTVLPRTSNSKASGFFQMEDTVLLGPNTPFGFLDEKIVPIVSPEKRYLFGIESEAVDLNSFKSVDELIKSTPKGKMMVWRTILKLSDTLVCVALTNNNNRNINQAYLVSKSHSYPLNIEYPNSEIYSLGDKIVLNPFDCDSLIVYDEKIEPKFYPKPKLSSDTKRLRYISGIDDESFVWQDGNLYQLDFQNDTLVYDLLFRGMDIQCLRAVIIKKDAICLASCSQGLFVLTPQLFENEIFPFTNSYAGVYSHMEIGKDSLIYKNALIDLNKPENNKLFDFEIANRYPLLDSKNRLWSIGSMKFQRMAQSFDMKKNWTRTNHNRRATKFQEDREGRIWGIYDDSIYCFENNNWFQYKLELPPQKGKTKLLYDKVLDKFWITSSSMTMLYDHSELSGKIISELDGISVRFVYTDDKKISWMTTYGNGLYGFRNDTLKSFKSRLPDNLSYSHCILEDDSSFFWISSNQGLYRAKKGELQYHFFNDTEEIIYMHRYSRKDGILNHEFNGGCYPCAVKRRDGSFSFPSMGGLVRFNPLDFTLVEYDSKITIAGLLLDGEQAEYENTIKIDQNFSRLQFQINAPYWGDPENLQLQYRLIQQNKNWIKMGDSRQIEFSKLEPGKYDLQIRRRLGFGFNNFEVLDASFYVKPFFYQTWWFRSTGGVFIVGLVLLVFVIRSRSAQRRAENLEEIILQKTKEYRKLNEKLKLNVARLRKAKSDQDLNLKIKDKVLGLYTHDIRGPLHFIISMIDSTDDVEEIPNEEMYKRLDMLKVTTQGIKQRTERIFNWLRMQEEGYQLNKENVSLYSLLGEIVESFNGQASKKKIEVKNSISNKAEVMNDRNILSIILSNIIDNAIKFTGLNGKIGVSSYFIDGYTVIIIKDSGIGMSQVNIDLFRSGKVPQSQRGTMNEEGKGYGLLAINELVKKIKGYIEIESRVGEGTAVSIFIKNLRED